jgi:glycogen synthase
MAGLPGWRCGADWYARASIYALPARYEPFGLSALEAALSGCALILGDIPSLREVWLEAAPYVSPDDESAPKSFARAHSGRTSARGSGGVGLRASASTLRFQERIAAIHHGVPEQHNNVWVSHRIRSIF